MTITEVLVLRTINERDIDNSQWGFVEDVDAAVYFGAHEDKWLHGYWVYVYVNINDMDYCPLKSLADEVMHYDGDDSNVILLFDMN